jgi:hypothetical protein
MTSRTIQIKSPYFVAAVVLNEYDFVETAAPIIRYMMKWPAEGVFGYCKRKGWDADFV